MQTVRGVFLDLSESTYYYTYKNLRFYFSSKQYLEKFENNFRTYIDNENLKLNIKYGLNINFDIMLAISYYRKIEKRGFRIIDISYNNELSSELKINDIIC